MAAGAAVWILGRRESQAHTWAATFSDMAETVDSLSSALDEERARRRAIEDDIGELKIKLYEYEDGIRVLLRQVIDLGETPRWTPVTGDTDELNK